MGSYQFQTIGYGDTPQAAYQDALEEARAENGHQDGYSGDIQTTEGFKMVNIDKGQSIDAKVEETIDNFTKWGPCGCIQLRGEVSLLRLGCRVAHGAGRRGRGSPCLFLAI